MLPVNAQPTLWEVLLPEMCLGMPAELEAVDGMLDDAGFFEPFRAYLHTVSTTRQRFHSVASYKESSPNNCWDSCWDTAQLSGVRWPRKAATRAYSEPEMGFEPMTCALRVRPGPFQGSSALADLPCDLLRCSYRSLTLSEIRWEL